MVNEHNEETDTDHPGPHPPLRSPFSIHLWAQISLFPMDRPLPSPPLCYVTPLLSLPSFIQQPAKLSGSMWPNTPTLTTYQLPCSQMCAKCGTCSVGFLGYLLGGSYMICLW